MVSVPELGIFSLALSFHSHLEGGKREGGREGVRE
jgi:hypothetical protein